MFTVLCLAATGISAGILSHPASRYAASSRLLPVRTATHPICCALPEAASMRMKMLKEELDGLGVAWKGIAFEREELVRMVEDARGANPLSPSMWRDSGSPAPPPPLPVDSERRSTSPGIENHFYAKFCSQCGAAATPSGKFCSECGTPFATTAVPASVPAAASSASGGGGGGGGGGDADPARMRVAQIKAELNGRRIMYSDCFDKEGLVERLLAARSGLVRPMQVRPSVPKNHVADQRGAAKGDFEFGVESRQGDEDDMDAAFRAAGWSGGEGAAQTASAASPLLCPPLLRPVHHSRRSKQRRHRPLSRDEPQLWERGPIRFQEAVQRERWQEEGQVRLNGQVFF